MQYFPFIAIARQEVIMQENEQLFPPSNRIFENPQPGTMIADPYEI